MKTLRDGWTIGFNRPTPSKPFLVHTSDAGRKWTNVTPQHVTLSVVGITGQQSLPVTIVNYLSGSSALTITESALSRNGTGTLLFNKTTDGGHNWHPWKVYLPNLVDRALINPILNQADFVNRHDGWLLFGPASAGVPGMAPVGMELWHTTNGGYNWTRVYQIPGNSAITASPVTFMSPTLGWMTTSHITPGNQLLHNVLMRTRDGGHTWARFLLPSPPDSQPIFEGRFGLIAVTRQYGRFTSNYRVILLHSADGGQHWGDPTPIPTPIGTPLTLRLMNTRLLWALTPAGRLLRSTTGGHRWTVQSTSAFLRHAAGADFINIRDGWVPIQTPNRPGQSAFRIWMTISGGKHWTSWQPVLSPNA